MFIIMYSITQRASFENIRPKVRCSSNRLLGSLGATRMSPVCKCRLCHGPHWLRTLRFAGSGTVRYRTLCRLCPSSSSAPRPMRACSRMLTTSQRWKESTSQGIWEPSSSANAPRARIATFNRYFRTRSAQLLLHASRLQPDANAPCHRRFPYRIQYPCAAV